MKAKILMAAILSWPFFSIGAPAKSVDILVNECAAELETAIASARDLGNICLAARLAAKKSNNLQLKTIAIAAEYVSSITKGKVDKIHFERFKKVLLELYKKPELISEAISLVGMQLSLANGSTTEAGVLVADLKLYAGKYNDQIHKLAKIDLKNIEARYSQKINENQRASELYDEAWILAKESHSEDRDPTKIISTLSYFCNFLQETGQRKKLRNLIRDAMGIEVSTEKDLHYAFLALTILEQLQSTFESDEDAENSIQIAENIVNNSEKRFDENSIITRRLRRALAAIYIYANEPEKSENTYKINFRFAQELLHRKHLDKAVSVTNITQANWPPVDIVVSITDLANLYKITDRPGDAIPMYFQALQLAELAFGKSSTEVAEIYLDLSKCYQEIGDVAAATRLSEIAYSIYGKKSHINSADIFDARLNLAKLYHSSKRTNAAISLLELNLQEISRKFGKASPERINTLLEIGSLLYTQEEYGLSAKNIKEAIDLIETHGLDVDVAYPTIMLATAISEGGKKNFDEAALVIRKAISNISKHNAGDSPALIALYSDLALYMSYKGGYSDEVDHLIAKVWKYIDFNDNDRKNSDTRIGMAAISLRLQRLQDVPSRESLEQSVYLAQRLRAEDTGAALRQAIVKLSSGDQFLINAFDKNDLLKKQIGQLEYELVKNVISIRPEKREILTKRLESLRKQQKANDHVIDVKTKDYSEYLKNQPIELNELQGLLQQDEAVVIYRVLDNHLHTWLVKKSDGMMHSQYVPSLQSQIGRASESLKSTGQIPVPNVTLLHDLYGILFSALEEKLDGISHVYVVPDGNIAILPHSVLVSSLPSATDANNFRKIDWLVRRFSFSYLPQVSSLKVIRGLKPSSTKSADFFGIGDPALSEDGTATQRGHASEKNGAVSRSQIIKDLGRIPDTGLELSSMAQLYEAKRISLYLGDDASEKSLRSVNLRQFSTIAFATHGVLPGEIGDNVEAGLIFTPGSENDESNDGFLGASDISLLKLNADFIVLSACNTGVPDMMPGRMPSSYGLSKPFFHAGARSILATLWSIDSEATSLLTTSILRNYEQSTTKNRAAALRNSILKMIEYSSNLEFSNPYFWGAFILIGEK